MYIKRIITLCKLYPVSKEINADPVICKDTSMLSLIGLKSKHLARVAK